MNVVNTATSTATSIYDYWAPTSDEETTRRKQHAAGDNDDGNITFKELPMDPREWPNMTKDTNISWSLRLEEWTHFDHTSRKDSQRRNVRRLEQATTATTKRRIDQLHLHYSVCLDPSQRRAIINFMENNFTNIKSVTMMGMHGGMVDWYSRPISAEDLAPLLYSFRKVTCLHLYSCPWSRGGHGLDALSKYLAEFTNLKELRLQGWQWDQVAINEWKAGLRNGESHHKNAVEVLSLQSCSFHGDGVVEDMIQSIARDFPQLITLNMSYCNLTDDSVVELVETLQQNDAPCLANLHIGGNDCVEETSVAAIGSWLQQKNCSLINLNLRALWVSYSEDHGLLHRPVQLCPLYDGLCQNSTLRHLSLAENNLDDSEIAQLLQSLQDRSICLKHFDVGDNPFSSQGAHRLLDWILHNENQTSKLESIRFENPYLTYTIAPLIHLQVGIHTYQSRLKSTPTPTTLPMWPGILESFGDGSQNHHEDGMTGRRQGDNEGTSHRINMGGDTPKIPQEDLIFHFLRATSGKFGLSLILRIATPHTSCS